MLFTKNGSLTAHIRVSEINQASHADLINNDNAYSACFRSCKVFLNKASLKLSHLKKLTTTYRWWSRNFLSSDLPLNNYAFPAIFVTAMVANIFLTISWVACRILMSLSLRTSIYLRALSCMLINYRQWSMHGTRTKWLPVAYKCTDHPKIWNVQYAVTNGGVTTSELSLISVWTCAIHCENIDLHIILGRSVYS